MQVIRWDDDEFARHTAAILEADVPEDEDEEPSAALVDAVFFFRRILSVEDRPPISKVVESPGVRVFAKIAASPCKLIAFQALWALTNIASGDSSHARAVVEADAIAHAVKILRDVHLVRAESLIIADPRPRIAAGTLTVRWGPRSGYAGAAGPIAALAAADAAALPVPAPAAAAAAAPADEDEMDTEDDAASRRAAAAAAVAAGGGAAAGGAGAALPTHGLFACDRDDSPLPREERDAVDMLDMVDQATWLLGNILGDSTGMRDMLSRLGVSEAFAVVMGHVLGVLHEHADRAHAEKVLLVTSRRTMTLLRNTAWACSNIARGKPRASLESVRPLLPGIAALASCVDTETSTDAMWFWSYASELEDGEFVKVSDVSVCRVWHVLFMRRAHRMTSNNVHRSGACMTRLLLAYRIDGGVRLLD